MTNDKLKITNSLKTNKKKYKLVEKGNPANTAAPKKWYANPVNQGTVSNFQISQDIAGRSSLTRGDVQNVIENLLDELPKYLVEGYSVNLGSFGTLRLSISGEGAETEAAYTPDKIKNVKVIFTPGLQMKKALEDVRFEKA